MTTLEVGNDFFYYSVEQQLPAQDGELPTTLYRCACHDSFEEVVIASLGALPEDYRRHLYDRALRLAHVDHHGLSPLFDSTTPDRRDCYVAWRIEPGRSLRSQLGDGPLDAREAAAVARAVGEGLSALHDAGETCGRVAPAAIWVARGGRAMLIAPGLGDPRDVPSEFESIATYRAPEQLEEGAVDQAVDTWAIGVLLFESLTGGLPFQSTDLEALLREMRQGPPPAVLVPGSIPDQLRPLVAECLSPEPDERPTMHELTSQLHEYLSALEPKRVARETSSHSVEIVTAKPELTQPSPAIDDWSATARWLKAEREKRASEPGSSSLWLGPGIVLAVLLALALWWLLGS